jgi:hypothetical protein
LTDARICKFGSGWGCYEEKVVVKKWSEDLLSKWILLESFSRDFSFSGEKPTYRQEAK